MNRRRLLAGAATLATNGILSAAARGLRKAHPGTVPGRGSHKLVIEPVKLEIAPKIVIPTVGYSGSVPGPLLRLDEGVPVTIDVENRTDVPELVHWHGLRTDSLNDGAMEEGSPFVPAHGHLSYHLTPTPSGSRWYHTHAAAEQDLARATYSGQYGFLYIQPKMEGQQFDREFFLQVHHWASSFEPMKEEPAQKGSVEKPETAEGHSAAMGVDVAYGYATINAHMLGHGEPLRVKRGERVMLRILNASATESVSLSLPQHSFTVVALDGNPVPHPKPVESLTLAVAERVDAIVEMNAPGVWILGSVKQEWRDKGLGIVVEYGDEKGKPIWTDAKDITWDYTRFAESKTAPDADQRFSILIKSLAPADGSHFNVWTMNGESWPKIAPLKVQQGKRYRLSFVNASPEAHPMHLHRHSFELTRVGRTHTSGLIKDVVNVPASSIAEVDFVADNPGDTLLHCHQQLHMDYGFMQLIKYT